MKGKTLTKAVGVLVLMLALVSVCVIGFAFIYPRSSLHLRIMRIQYSLGKRDFSGAKLGSMGWQRPADLSGFNLSEADLSEADLRWADLREADLSGADLTRADLSGADLSEADLSGTDLRGIDLREASIDNSNKLDAKWQLVWELVSRGGADRDLSGADLSGANLSGADLSGADLSGADLSEADLEWANLRSAMVTDEQLALAASLRGATLPDGSKHE